MNVGMCDIVVFIRSRYYSLEFSFAKALLLSYLRICEDRHTQFISGIPVSFQVD